MNKHLTEEIWEISNNRYILTLSIIERTKNIMKKGKSLVGETFEETKAVALKEIYDKLMEKEEKRIEGILMLGEGESELDIKTTDEEIKE